MSAPALKGRGEPAGLSAPPRAPSHARPPRAARRIALGAAAALALAAGYADLARGSVTAAPVLLVLGYCVLVPLAILK